MLLCSFARAARVRVPARKVTSCLDSLRAAPSQSGVRLFSETAPPPAGSTSPVKPQSETQAPPPPSGSVPPPASDTSPSAASGTPPPPAAGTPPPPASGVPPPASATPPPPANSPPPASETPPPADSAPAGFHCGGFFFAFDPNIGLWNDRVNPNWRLTFTDRQSNTKQRIPYAFVIQHRGPHFELGLRFQFGFVFSDSSFAAPPQTLDVESGWELTFPLPFSGVRLGHTIVRTNNVNEAPAHATVYCIDLAFGFCAGFQKALSGVGTKGAPEETWRGNVAMVFFVAAVLWGLYNLVTLPSTWRELIDELYSLSDDPEMEMFEALDFDGDGFISRDDVRNFVNQGELANQQFDPDALFDALDTAGTGRVTFEQFQASLEALMNASQETARMASLPQRPDVPLQPFGGVFTPGLSGPGLVPPLYGGFKRPVGEGPRSPWD